MEEESRQFKTRSSFLPGKQETPIVLDEEEEIISIMRYRKNVLEVMLISFRLWIATKDKEFLEKGKWFGEVSRCIKKQSYERHL